MKTHVIAQMRAKVDPRTGILAASMFPISTQNGLGFKSITYTTAIPQWDFWNHYRDRTDPQTFETVFNRYSNIFLTDDAGPRVLANDAIAVPSRWFNEPANQ